MSESNHFEFKAEIKKLLDILSRSLYQHKEVYLRELISNAADALSKIRFIQLTDKSLEDLPLEIEVAYNSKENTLHVRDTGIGMTKDELIEQLGTIAGSGSERFFKKLQETADKDKKEIDLDIIGQFGVGFYSVFMVADKVRVISKSYKDTSQAYAWESEGTGEFIVEEAEKETRGTEVILFLNDEEKEYLSKFKLESIIKKYSNYVPFPIFVKEEGKTEVDVSLDEDEEDKTTDEEEDGTEEAEVEEKEPERQPVNKIQPLWKKKPNKVTDEEYKEFYQFIARRWDDYKHVIHYNVDGVVQFNSITYIPGERSNEMVDVEVDYGLALYSKKILIMEHCKDLVPRWLRFVKGVVDSQDIPLNVSRDTIQNNRVIMKIKDLIEKKIIKELLDIAENDPDTYKGIWKEFNFFIKEGIVTDQKMRDELLKLLRVNTSKTKDGELKGLEEYVKDLPENTKEIFYLVGENLNTMRISPHLGYYNKEGIEVILFDESVDNYLMMNVREFKTTEGEGDDKEEVPYTFTPIDVSEATKKGEKDSEEGEDEEKEDQEEDVPEDVRKFLDHVKKVLGDKIVEAKISDKLYDNAYRLANPAGGMTSSMQRVMRYYTMKVGGQDFEIPRKVLELNPEHPMVQKLMSIYKNDPENGRIAPVIKQMFDNALLAEGDLPEPAKMVPRINQLLEMVVLRKDDVKNPFDELEDPIEDINSESTDDDAKSSDTDDSKDN